MFQHALIVCLKWISGVSLPFRPSSSTCSHFTWPTTALVAAWGAEGMNPSVRPDVKRAAHVRLARGKLPKKLQGGGADYVMFLCFKFPPQATHQWSGGSRQPKLETECQPTPLQAIQFPSTQPWSTITTCHLPFHWWKKGCLLHEGIHG